MGIKVCRFTIYGDTACLPSTIALNIAIGCVEMKVFIMACSRLLTFSAAPLVPHHAVQKPVPCAVNRSASNILQAKAWLLNVTMTLARQSLVGSWIKSSKELSSTGSGVMLGEGRISYQALAVAEG